MRLWSLHPQYLDRQGLLAVWREGLLAQHVLSGLTRGYKNHPQLQRFKEHTSPLQAIGNYLDVVVQEAARRGYIFDRSKIQQPSDIVSMGQGIQINNFALIAVSTGQVAYETAHLRAKLAQRDPARVSALPSSTDRLLVHPLFYLIDGGVADWERVVQPA